MLSGYSISQLGIRVFLHIHYLKLQITAPDDWMIVGKKPAGRASGL